MSQSKNKYMRPGGPRCQLTAICAQTLFDPILNPYTYVLGFRIFGKVPTRSAVETFPLATRMRDGWWFSSVELCDRFYEGDFALSRGGEISQFHWLAHFPKERVHYYVGELRGLSNRLRPKFRSGDGVVMDYFWQFQCDLSMLFWDLRKEIRELQFDPKNEPISLVFGDCLLKTTDYAKSEASSSPNLAQLFLAPRIQRDLLAEPEEPEICWLPLHFKSLPSELFEPLMSYITHTKYCKDSETSFYRDDVCYYVPPFGVIFTEVTRRGGFVDAKFSLRCSLQERENFFSLMRLIASYSGAPCREIGWSVLPTGRETLETSLFAVLRTLENFAVLPGPVHLWEIERLDSHFSKDLKIVLADYEGSIVDK